MKDQSQQISSHCQVDVFNRQKEVDFKADPEIIRNIIHTVLDNESERADYVSIHFLSDRLMRHYHNRFFHDPSSTDCMSFPLDDNSDEGSTRHLGDIFVCPITALRYVDYHEDRFWPEITLYIVHGMLHLLGYDDIDPPSRSLMRQHEQRALSLLKNRGLALSGTIHSRRQVQNALALNPSF